MNIEKRTETKKIEHVVIEEVPEDVITITLTPEEFGELKTLINYQDKDGEHYGVHYKVWNRSPVARRIGHFGGNDHYPKFV